MSLLMDALRQAEQAKRRAAQAEGAGAVTEPSLAAPGTPSLATDSRPLPEDEPQLPDLPELPGGLELLDRQISAAEARPATPPAPPLPAPAAEDLQANRAAARALFEAKPPASRLPFWLGLSGATLAAGGGLFWYFWMQLQPLQQSSLLPPGAMLAPAPLPAPAAPVPAAPSAATPVAEPPPAPPAASPRGPQAITATAASDPPPPPPRRRSASPAPSAGVLGSGPAEESAPGDDIRLTRSRPGSAPDSGAAAYEAYLAGDLRRAQAQYEAALRADPRNTDALNGLAAVALRENRPEHAEAWYRRTLEANPADATANAALIAIYGEADPVQAETRLKLIAAAQPEAAAPQFGLGNVYARQERWSDAQQAYFRAYTAEPDNPDYMFNLAVALDRLRQPGLARQYYERALAAAQTRPAAFDPARVSARLKELQLP